MAPGSTWLFMVCMQRRVLKLLSQSFLPNQGRYPRIHSEAHSLIEGGYAVDVLGWNRSSQPLGDEEIDGICVSRVAVRSGEMRGPIQAIYLLGFFFKALWKLRGRHYEVIHCHNLDVLPLGYLIARLKGSRLVFDAHEPNYYALWPKRWQPLLRLINGLEVWLARRCDYVLVTNDYQYRKFRQNEVRAVEVIGNYPAKEFIVHDVPKKRFRGSGIVFGRIGTIYPDIGLEEAVTAYQRVLERYPQTKLFLAGRLVEAYAPIFRKLLEPVRDKVKYAGAYSAPDLPRLYKMIDVSLLPYRKNLWFSHITPTKFYDSLAAGVPVIMSDIGGLGHIVEEYGCGLVVEESDIGQIEAAMCCFIEDRKFGLRAARGGLRLIRERMNWGLASQRLLQIYDKLCR